MSCSFKPSFFSHFENYSMDKTDFFVKRLYIYYVDFNNPSNKHRTNANDNYKY
jgi:hypothetical protein